MAQGGTPTTIPHLPEGQGRTVRLLGETYTIKLGSEDTGGALALIDQSVPPGAPGPPLHRHHRTDETFYVLAGELEFVADGTTVRGDAGSVVHVPRGVLHTYRNPGPGTARHLLLLSPAGFEAFFVEAAAAITADIPDPSDIERLLIIARSHDLEIPPPPVAP